MVRSLRNAFKSQTSSLGMFGVHQSVRHAPARALLFTSSSYGSRIQQVSNMLCEYRTCIIIIRCAKTLGQCVVVCWGKMKFIAEIDIKHCSMLVVHSLGQCGMSALPRVMVHLYQLKYTSATYNASKPSFSHLS